ncbi:hypothetical protein NLU13_2343 [Sarocladium strictum]|nr:hypothetical protein NLU13_2343 [Sarocladium strictum]
MLGAHDAASTYVEAVEDRIPQTESEGGEMAPGLWDNVDPLCCGTWWPNLTNLYAPLPAQGTDSWNLFEPYRDVVQAPTPIVSQQYISPGMIEQPGPNYIELGAPIAQAATLCAPTAVGLHPNPPALSVRDEAPLMSALPAARDLQLAPHIPLVYETNTDFYTVHLQSTPFDCMLFSEPTSGQDIRGVSGAVGGCEPQRPAEHSPLSEHPILFDVVGPSSKSKRGPFRDNELRQQTAATRSQGACIECARQRIRCILNANDPTGPCVNCLRMLSVRMPRIPCLRYRITDVKLSKTEQVPGYEWTRRWSHTRKNIKNWASEEVKTIYISEGLSNTQMKFHVKRFVPQTGDKLDRSWVHHGNRRSVTVPPYALTRLEDAKAAYQQHIVATESGALKHVLGLSAPLLRETYDLAVKLRHANDLDDMSKGLLDITFQLWMVVRFSTMSTWIVGEETLGMSRNILDTSPNPGRIPLPPVLGAQLDSVLIHEFQESIRHKLLRQLDKAFRKYKHPNWLVMYLVSFILLHNAALITAHDAKYAQKHGMQRRFAREGSVADYHKGATIILAHFHNCTRNHPFSDRCNDSDLKNLARMTEDQIRFVRDTRMYIKLHEREWERIREEGLYEHDFYFVSQLYQEPWKPEPFNVEPGSSGSEGSSVRSESSESEAGSDPKE